MDRNVLSPELQGGLFSRFPYYQKPDISNYAKKNVEYGNIALQYTKTLYMVGEQATGKGHREKGAGHLKGPQSECGRGLNNSLSGHSRLLTAP